MITCKVMLKWHDIPCQASSDPVGNDLFKSRVPFWEKSGPNYVYVIALVNTKVQEQGIQGHSGDASHETKGYHHTQNSHIVHPGLGYILGGSMQQGSCQ